MTKKIMVADDEEEIIEMIRSILEIKGYSVVSTSIGSRLPNMVKKEKPDLLILDVLLPGLDGYSLLQQFSEDEFAKNLPVIIITALPATRSLFDKFSQVRIFLDKPFNSDVLLNKIKEILGE